jgi:hypothetical protein
MDEDTINAQDLVNPEEQPKEVLPTEEVQEAKPVEAAKPEQPIVQENTGKSSFSKLRMEKESIQKERDEMRRKLDEIESLRQQSKPVQQEQEEESDLNADDFVEGKHLSKVTKKIKNLERQLEEYQQRSSLMTTEARLKAEHPDFDKVVSKDNIEVLNLTYPELAASVSSTPDLYVRAKAAYTLIKKLGIEQDMTSYEQENERANKNLAKPKPAINMQQGDSPLSMANAFAAGTSKEARMKIYKQAQEYANKKGFN